MASGRWPVQMRWLGIVLLLLLTQSGLLADDVYAHLTYRIEQLRTTGLVRVSQIGASVKGRPILAVAITGPSEVDPPVAERARLLVLSGQHGNEATPVRAALDTIDDLMNGQDTLARNALARVIVVMVPAVNPDGLAAGRRVNAHGFDLNRDWSTPNQPETIAVQRLIAQFRPHVVVDQHEWSKGDPYTGNCIEAPSFDDTAACRLSQLLAQEGKDDLEGRKLLIARTSYRPSTDRSLAHRSFVNSGMSGLLLETSPRWPEEERIRIYRAFTASVIRTLAYSENAEIRKSLRIVRRKQSGMNRDFARLCMIPQQRPVESKPSYTTMAAIACAGLLLVILVTPGTTTHEPKRIGTVADVLDSDLSAREKREMLKSLRNGGLCRGEPRVRPKLRNHHQSIGVTYTLSGEHKVRPYEHKTEHEAATRET